MDFVIDKVEEITGYQVMILHAPDNFLRDSEGGGALRRLLATVASNVKVNVVS